MITAVNIRDSWVVSDNAKVKWRRFARGAVNHDTEIVAFTATPAGDPKQMRVQPQSGLHVQIEDAGLADLDIDALEVLEMIEHHIRWTVVESWFERGFMPPPWAEVEAMQQPSK
jgi:hypothetical protein